MSFASLYRKALRESLQVELDKHIKEIEASTHCVIGKWNKLVYYYGNLEVCKDFAKGLEREVLVIPMDVDTKKSQKMGKIQAYRETGWR